MAAYFLAFLWGICILLAFAGWGGLLNRTVFRRHRIDWGQRAAWGLSFFIFLGGWLNLACKISRAIVLLCVGCGVAFSLFDLLLRRRRKSSLAFSVLVFKRDRWLLAGALLVLLLALLQYAGSVALQLPPGRPLAPAFNLHDDLQAYFVFPQKMLQTGCLGPDPFSERRINVSLGGQPFLDTFVLSVLPSQNLELLDAGVGMVLVVALLIGYFRERGTPARRAVCVLLLFLLLRQPRLNISSLLVGMAVFLSLFRTLAWKELNDYPWVSRAFLVGLITGALCSLKSSLIPACVLLFLFSYAFFVFGSAFRTDAIKEFLAATLCVFIVLLPWMLSMYQSSGTPLYPILGKGYHGTAYGTFQAPFRYVTISGLPQFLADNFLSISFVVLCVLGALAVGSRWSRPVGRGALMALLSSAVLGTLITAVALAGYDTYRFTFPFVSAATLVFMTELVTHASAEKNGNGKTLHSLLITAVAAGLLIGPGWDRAKFMYLSLFRNIRIGIQNPSWITDEGIAQYQQMQKRVPEGATLFARLEKPFLLDFRRNTIFIVDSPEGASLPPGMPCFQGPEPLADYLVSKSIRYVAYSYASEAASSKKEFAGMLRPGIHPWIRALFQHAFDFQDNLEQLGRTRKRIYDDGEIFVLDLFERVR